ncbi:CPBP family intramembrane metalloprotease [Acinetobacter wanghuae]|uniref:CPBP family intramembrane metalloprotease n=1 Tax=Acinetobacter wanghuae TaxID=2662362 RepID=A0A5Q0P4A6_9GAMM|nr:type II CAAX endopeptidase family protein [Acinetobacter wanghuae]MQW91198.1 CPBP family intramembrane metalloprotease [Acinetobacter wanghuae]QGA11250.1 CPBP family intramembrane metalloprotease [Acinetobacter wanghuae]
MKFQEIVRAENFPNQISWQLKDSFALLLIPLIFINAWLASLIFTDQMNIAIADSLFRGILFLILCVIYKRMLTEHWFYFNQAKWKSWGVVIVGAVLLQVVISLTKSILPISATSENFEKSIDPQSIAFFTLLFISFGPLFMALIEDIVFRYTLLHKLFIPNILFRVVVVLLNSIVFGLIHYHNFGGDLIATSSFMVAGLFLNLIYIWTRNIWHVLLIHFMNNGVLSLGGVLLLKAVTMLT